MLPVILDPNSKRLQGSLYLAVLYLFLHTFSNLNYPSIGIGAMSGHMSIYRTVTFKGGRKDPQIFKVSVDSPPDVT
ncbi:hypothetical protein FF1_008569 [Malus domestica]